MRGKFRFTREQWYLMIVLGILKISLALSGSLQGPLFPREAELKGATASEYGLVFGTYALVSFISCPIYGNYIDRIGYKKMLIWGTSMIGISIIGFGLLDQIDSHVPFITMAFILRTTEALAYSAVITSLYSVTVVIFYDSIATSFAITEGIMGLGFMFGPILAGCLYQVGGYMLPFISMGMLMLLEAALVYFLFPDIPDNSYRDLELSQVKVRSLLMVLPVFLDLFGISSASMVTGFNASTLEPHLRQFNLAPVIVGMIFMIGPAMYVLLSPIVGSLCDTMFYPKHVIIFGSSLIFVGMALVGPVPFLPMDTTLCVVCFGLLLHGLGHVCILIPTYIDAIHSAVALGLRNDMALYGVVSGLTQSAFSLGDAIGPSVGGVLVDYFGFRYGTLFLLTVHAFLIVAMLVYVCTERRGGCQLSIDPALHYESIKGSNYEEEQNSEWISHSGHFTDYYDSD